MKEELEKYLKLNLQFFADDDSGSEDADSDSSDDDSGDDDGNSKGDGETIELTADELAKRIESESDKKLNKVLDKKMKEWEADYNQKLENAKKEGERLAKLSAKERQEEDIKKRSDALSKREQELLTKELKAQTIADLHEKSLPPKFADFLMGNDADSTLENIKTFKSDYDKAIEVAVEERLKGKSPNAGTGSTGKETGGSKSQEQFMEIFNKHRIIGK